MTAEPFGGLTAVTIFVSDVARSAQWYRQVFAAPVVFEDDVSIAFSFDTVVVNLLHVSAAPELVEPRPVAAGDTVARSQLTVTVADVDGACRRLTELGVALLNGPVDRPWGPRTAAFTDPDGHVWELAQPG